MPTTLTFSGARIPNQNEAGDPSADFARFGGDIDDKVVLKATSQSDRDTKYSSVPAGTVVTCASLRTAWMKLSTPPTAASWMVLAESLDPVTSGYVGGRSGFSTTSQWAKRTNGFWDFRATFTWSGSTITASTGNGDLSSDVLFGTLQAGYLPGNMGGNVALVIQAATCTGVGHLVTVTGGQTAGDMYITSLVPGGTISSGQIITVSGRYLGA